MNRRRSISILAGATAAALSGCGSGRRAPVTRWRGVLFNANVDLAIHDLPRREAERLIASGVAEMQRLEGMFSLFVPDSTLCVLNRNGRVVDPPAEFTALVREALAIAERSGGCFDPTVQPYWLWLRDAVESGRGVDPERQRGELAKVDYRKVKVTAEEVRFAKRGMGMTLNGIAQGWITDRVCDLLRAHGAAHSLVNLGEFFAIGPQPAGGDWRVAIRGAEEELVDLCERALAVSCGAGHFFGTGAGRNHLIDPRSGDCAEDRRIVAVTAPDATSADALSTACAILGDREGKRLVGNWRGAEVRIIRPA